MKLIFLDVDGVLNNHASIAMSVLLIAEKVIMVNDLAIEADAHVVISSTWRKDWPERDLKEILRIVGFRSTERFAGYTPKGFNFTCRGEEIKSVLDANDVEAYVILDDNSDMLPEQMENLVLTRMDIGLTYREINKARKILGVIKDEPVE